MRLASIVVFSRLFIARPTPPLRFCNPRPAFGRRWPGRLAAVETTAFLPRLNPHQTRAPRASFGPAPWPLAERQWIAGAIEPERLKLLALGAGHAFRAVAGQIPALARTDDPAIAAPVDPLRAADLQAGRRSRCNPILDCLATASLISPRRSEPPRDDGVYSARHMLTFVNRSLRPHDARARLRVLV